LCRATYIRRENTIVRGAEEESKRVYLRGTRTWKMALYFKYGGRAEYQISRNELPCAKSPIVRDLIGDCRELSVFKPHVFDTRVARNII